MESIKTIQAINWTLRMYKHNLIENNYCVEKQGESQ